MVWHAQQSMVIDTAANRLISAEAIHSTSALSPCCTCNQETKHPDLLRTHLNTSGAGHDI